MDLHKIRTEDVLGEFEGQGQSITITTNAGHLPLLLGSRSKATARLLLFLTVFTY